MALQSPSLDIAGGAPVRSDLGAGLLLHDAQPHRGRDPDHGRSTHQARLSRWRSRVPRSTLPVARRSDLTLVLAFFFMMLNLTVDVIQTTVDPRIKRG